MDPITASTTFATIVGLICNFRQERAEREALDHQKFMAWLEYHRHEDIKNLISNTQHLAAELDRVLQRGQTEILQQLSQANSILAQLVSRIDGLSGIVQILAPRAEFSEQAISILEQLQTSGYPEIELRKFSGGFRLMAFGFGSTGPEITTSEPLFAEDDLNKLADYDLLRPRMSSGGTAFYGITRAATQFLSQVRPKPPG